MTRYDHRGGKGKLALARRQRPDPGDASQDRGLVATTAAEYAAPTGLAIERRPSLVPVAHEAKAAFAVVRGDTALSRVGGTFGTSKPASRAGEKVMLRWVSEETIPLEHRELVARHMDEVRRSLQLGPVATRWFKPSPDGRGDFVYTAPKGGMLPAAITPNPTATGERGYIGLNASMRGEDLVRGAVAHELRHVWQIRLRELLEDVRWCEADADQWAASYLAEAAS